MKVIENKRDCEQVEGDPLPIIEGVAASRQWLPAGPWQTILHFLEERFPAVQTSTWLSRMARGQLVDETGLRLTPESPYRVGACVYYYREVESEPQIPFLEHVLFQDEHILVADKPHFLPVVPSGRFLHETLLVRLRKKGNSEHLAPIHRIDRDAAGIVVFSINPASRGAYASLFHRREVFKFYEAIAPTLVRLDLPTTRRSRIVRGEPFFRMTEIEGTPNSETHIDVLRGMGDTTLYCVRPVTGKKHQIRLHLSALGIPIVNDRLYPVVSAATVDDFSSPLKLLARGISFKDPLTGRERGFETKREL